MQVALAHTHLGTPFVMSPEVLLAAQLVSHVGIFFVEKIDEGGV